MERGRRRRLRQPRPLHRRAAAGDTLDHHLGVRSVAGRVVHQQDTEALTSGKPIEPRLQRAALADKPGP